MKSAAKPVFSLVFSLLGAASLSAAPTDNIYTAGHADIGVAYEDGELHLHNHFAAGTVVNGTPLPAGLDPEAYEYDLSDVTTYVPLSAAITTNSSQPNSMFGLPSSGGTLYYLPATQIDDLPFLGVDGPGEFSVWNNGTFGTFNFYFSTNDPAGTVNGNNTLVLPTGTHAHYNWGFTAPGIYEVEIMVSGTHATDGFVSDTQTVTFGVGVIPEPSTYALIIIAALVAVVFTRKRKRAC